MDQLNDKLKNRINELDNQNKIKDAQEQIDLLQQQKDIPEEELIKVYSQLQELPDNDPTVLQLTKQVDEIKSKKDANDTLKRKLNDDINSIGLKLSKIENDVYPDIEGKKKGKKGKKQQHKDIAGNTLDDKITNIRNAINEINDQIIPELNNIEINAQDNLIDIPLLKEQEEKAQLLNQQLNNELNEKEKEKEKYDNLNKNIEIIQENVQKHDINNLPDNLDQQEKLLNDLEEEKHKLINLLDTIPEGSEGDEIREKSQWNLNKLQDLLNKIGDLVGEKASALAAFMNSKKAVEDQLNLLNNDIDMTLNSIDENTTSNELQDKINSLLAEEARIQAITSKLADDQIKPESLDDDKKRELEDLRKNVELSSRKLEEARNDIKNKLDKIIEKEQLEADTNRYYNNLADLIKEAHDTINDETAIPTSYKQLADRLNDSINESNNFINNASDPLIVETLKSLIPTGQNEMNELNKRFDLWNEFIKERDIANEQLDIARQSLDKYEKENELKSLEEAEKELETLKVCFKFLNLSLSFLQKILFFN